MAMPPRLKEAVEGRLAGLSGRDLARAYERLSQAYHENPGQQKQAGTDDFFWMAYLASRLPATYAALAAALESLKQRLPGFSPQSLCDLGAGPGTASWAALQVFPTLQKLTLIENDPEALRLAEGLGLAGATFTRGDLASGAGPGTSHDLVVAGYVLGELPPAALQRVVLNAWSAASKALVLVEPGTPAGYKRILAARNWLLEKGALIAAPCTHQEACPLAGEDWCHFGARLERSSLHRQIKAGVLSYEDEKFSYLAAVRSLPAGGDGHRILRRPRLFKGHLRLDLCGADGKTERTVSRKDGEIYRKARKADWGDSF